MNIIEKGVPIPPLRRPKIKKYPWRELKVGESFLIENQIITTVSSLAYNASKRTGLSFVCRTVEGGVRVWRVK